jgi:sulfur carrier protein
MITINGENVEYESSLTVFDMLKNRGFVFPLLIVRINGKLISRDSYDKTQISDGDRVDVIHMMSGG